METEIDRYQSLLNSPELVEARWYQRTHKAYELLCYVNTIMGLYSAQNYELIPAFLDRVQGYLAREDKAQISGPYREVVETYIRLLARSLASSPELSAEAKGWIPASLLSEP